jgi:hypothetical protein
MLLVEQLDPGEQPESTPFIATVLESQLLI